MNFVQKLKSIFTVRKENHKALTLGDAVPAVVALTLIAIVGAVALLILQNFQSNSAVTVNSAAYNGIGYGITGINTVLSFQGLLGLVVIAAIIIGIARRCFCIRHNKEAEGKSSNC